MKMSCVRERRVRAMSVWVRAMSVWVGVMPVWVLLL